MLQSALTELRNLRTRAELAIVMLTASPAKLNHFLNGRGTEPKRRGRPRKEPRIAEVAGSNWTATRRQAHSAKMRAYWAKRRRQVSKS